MQFCGRICSNLGRDAQVDSYARLVSNETMHSCQIMAIYLLHRRGRPIYQACIACMINTNNMPDLVCLRYTRLSKRLHCVEFTEFGYKARELDFERMRRRESRYT